MKIVHVLSQNLQIFANAVEGTDCCINGCKDVESLIKTYTNYNARDVYGLVIFQQYITKKTLRFIKMYDEFFMFNPKPIIIICDNSEELCATKKIRVTYAPLFAVSSLDGTISDIDLRRVFTTLVCMSGSFYELQAVEKQLDLVSTGSKIPVIQRSKVEEASSRILDEVESLFSSLNELGCYIES